MAFADLLDPNTYARRDNRSYSDLVAAALKNQQAAGNVQATGLENQYNQATIDPRVAEQASKALSMDQANQESGMTLEANRAIHPEIMRQLRTAGQAQAAPQVTPALAPSFGPQEQGLPFMLGQGAPQSTQSPAQQAQGPSDPYAERTAIQQEKAKMLQQEQGEGAALALNPTFARLHEQDKTTLAAREAANNEAIGLRQNADWNDLKKNTLDKIMTPPAGGWNPLRGDKAAALAEAMKSIPGSMMDNPKVKEWVTAAKGEQQNTVFNPAGMAGVNNRLVGTYVSKFDHAQEQYEKKVTPLQNLTETMNSPTWGTAAGDVSLINQLSLAEFGGYKPSEAEYKAFGTGFTPAQYAQKWLGMAQTGNVLPQQVRDNMVKEVENVAKRSHDNFTTTMAEQKKRVQAAGVNPDEVIYPGGAYQNMQEYFGKKPTSVSGANPAGGFSPAVVSQAKAYLALPADQQDPKVAAHARKALGQ